MKLTAGDQLEIDGVTHRITAISATIVALQDLETGIVKEILISDLIRLPGVRPEGEHAGINSRADLAAFQYLDDDSRNKVNFWLVHLRELESAISASVDASLPPTGPINAKLAELAELGRSITERTLRRKRKAFRESGVAGLINQRQQRAAGERRRVDARVIAALAEIMDGQTNASTGTRIRLVNLTRQLLAERFGSGVVEMPTERTMLRVIDDLDRGRMTTGSAKTRRSLANRPDRTFFAMGVSRPGEQVQIDSTEPSLVSCRRFVGGFVF